MHHRLGLALAAALLLPISAGSVMAAPAGICRARAIAQLRTAPDGLAIYDRIEDKAFFAGWLDCSDRQYALPTAVHETVHHITADTDAFPLVGGGDVARPHAVSSFFAPSIIARRFGRSDFVDTYLKPGGASSATDFLYLLDELNAYSHELNTAVDLAGMTGGADEREDHRDGLAALMAFVAVYVETARDNQPVTWSGLRRPEVADTLSLLWGRAETVLASSCGIPDFGAEDRRYIRQFCEAGARSALKAILGRAPVCPTNCLSDAATVAQRDADIDPAETTGSIGGSVPQDHFADQAAAAPAARRRPPKTVR